MLGKSAISKKTRKTKLLRLLHDWCWAYIFSLKNEEITSRASISLMPVRRHTPSTKLYHTLSGPEQASEDTHFLYQTNLRRTDQFVLDTKSADVVFPFSTQVCFELIIRWAGAISRRACWVYLETAFVGWLGNEPHCSVTQRSIVSYEVTEVVTVF